MWAAYSKMILEQSRAIEREEDRDLEWRSDGTNRRLTIKGERSLEDYADRRKKYRMRDYNFN